VLDEAYIELADQPRGLVDWIQNEPRLVVLRTMSKAFGLAGARLGYVVASAETIEVLDLLRLPFNVNALTARVACEALADPAGLWASVALVRAERARLAERLQRIPGLEVQPSQANFLFVRAPDAPELCARLLQGGILIRDRSGLPGCGTSFRVTVGRPEDNDRLVEALARCREVSG
jgi:histidinol-phosphate aminotransferase